MHSNSGMPLDRRLVVRARRRRGVLCRRAGRDRGRRRPLSRRGRRRAGRGRLRRAAGRRRLPQRDRLRAPAVRRELNSNIVATYKVAYGDADAAFAKAAHVFHEELWQHRGAAHPIEGARHPRGMARRRRHDGLGLDPEGARPVPDADLAARFRREPAARGDPRRRRRLRPQALRLSRGHRRGRGGQAARPLDQMDRGPARAFHQRGPGARPVLVARDRGRRRCQGARHPRQADPRHSAPTRCRTSTSPTTPPRR